jgi:hypothetical protein
LPGEDVDQVAAAGRHRDGRLDGVGDLHPPRGPVMGVQADRQWAIVRPRRAHPLEDLERIAKPLGRVSAILVRAAVAQG